MMHINTHEAYKKLVDAGVQDKAAETIILVIDESRKSDFDNLATKEDIGNIRTELKADIANVRLETANVRSELKEDIANLRAELKQDISNVRTEIAGLRTELKEDIATLRTDIAELKGNDVTMRWMLGFLLAMCSAILLKLFLGI